MGPHCRVALARSWLDYEDSRPVYSCGGAMSQARPFRICGAMTPLPPIRSTTKISTPGRMQQADLLRRLPLTSNSVDAEHVAEEIEDLGRSDLRTAQSLVEHIIEHFLKLEFAGLDDPAEHWRDEIVERRLQLDKTLTRSIEAKLDLPCRYKSALRLLRRLERDVPGLMSRVPQACPVHPRSNCQRRGGLVPDAAPASIVTARAAAIPRCEAPAARFEGCGRGFDPLFEFLHQPAARPAGRDRFEKFERDAAGPLPETAPAPKQTGIDRRRNQRQRQCLVQPVDAGLVTAPSCPVRRASLADRSRSGVPRLRPGAPRRACGATPPLPPCGRSRWRRRAPCTSRKTGQAAAPF